MQHPHALIQPVDVIFEHETWNLIVSFSQMKYNFSVKLEFLEKLFYISKDMENRNTKIVTVSFVL